MFFITGNVDRKRFHYKLFVNIKFNNTDMSNKKFIVDFGLRSLYSRQYSIVISLPKLAIKNCADGEFQKVSVKLVNENGEKYLKLTPVFDLKRVI